MVAKSWLFWLSIITILLATMLLQWIGPIVETRFFPVYSRFAVEDIRAAEGGTEARFRFTKFRDCDARGWAWYVGDFGATSRQVEVKSTENAVDRPLGMFVSNPYFIAADPNQVSNEMYVEIHSRCHPFWLTVSVVYP